ncbi:unnamed protein product [Heterobilharzia americana]|nr:unnamed protein product [Heterobilharzia americana]
MALYVRDYEEDKKTCSQFLRFYSRIDSCGNKHFVYSEQLSRIANREQSVLYVSLDDLAEQSIDLVEIIECNAVRYQKLFAEVIDELLPDFRTVALVPQDVLDIFIDHRIRMEQRIRTVDSETTSREPESTNMSDVRSRFPPELLRRFIGHLIQVRGVVTRATEVKPLITTATYTCDHCGAESYQEINNPTFMPLTVCGTAACKNAGRVVVVDCICKPEDPSSSNFKRFVYRNCLIKFLLRGASFSGSGKTNQASVSVNTAAGGLLTDTYLEAHSVQLLSKTDDVTDANEPSEEKRNAYVIQSFTH